MSMSSNKDHWIPDNPDGSGWADVDWPSVARGSRYHYEHGLGLDEARAARPKFYKVVTRLESETIIPHNNTYYVTGDALADFVAEFVWNDGAEIVWHIEPCDEPPREANVT
jgi:hypothetical protein